MDKLIILNLIVIAIDVGVLILLKKFCKSDRSIYIALLILSILTILCHYSSLLYHYIKDNSAMDYLKANPNLILPIYPCNIVMWLSLVFGIMRNKQSLFGKFLMDYLFWFGVLSAIVGMFANVDFVRNPNLRDFDIFKGVLSHGLLLLNALALPVLGFVKIKLERNILNIVISTVMMFIVGLYCNLMFEVIGDAELAFEVNSMFIIHSPFNYDDKMLTFPLISVIIVFAYFITFVICELFAYKHKDRWYYRLFSKKSKSC